jgi:hypothetical protein
MIDVQYVKGLKKSISTLIPPESTAMVKIIIVVERVKKSINTFLPRRVQQW